MSSQMTISEYLSDRTHDRNGRLSEAPEWMDAKRCETCRHWQILPVDDQPPYGWGVKGQCNYSHEPEMMRNGYWIVGSNSYCNDYEVKI